VGARSDPGRDFRWAALQAGFWLGWLSIAALLAALLFDRAGQHRPLLVAFVAAAAVANAAMMVVPWRGWLTAARGQFVLDVWSGGLIAFATLLVVLAGARADFDLLFFLVLPFVASVQSGWRRPVWLTAAAIAFLLATLLASSPLAGGAVVVRALLLSAAVVLALVLGRAVRRQAAAGAEAAARAELEGVLLAEAHHRVKNSLQTVADLLLLARPTGQHGHAFDDTATRIRSIAAVHRLLADSRGGNVQARAILEAVAAVSAESVSVEADAVALPADRAQQLGIVANELIENAVRHGHAPITVRLTAGPPARLHVNDRGAGVNSHPKGLGLQLVSQVVEQGLQGEFRLEPRPDGGTHAEVVFDADADPDR
jgi:two-component sensor histidine kinase